MGMDLVPRKGGQSVHYNWSGWRALIAFLGEDLTPAFSGSNDGDYINAPTCHDVADAIESRRNEYNAIYASPDPGGYGNDPATEHAKAWRESGGMRQW